MSKAKVNLGAGWRLAVCTLFVAIAVSTGEAQIAIGAAAHVCKEVIEPVGATLFSSPAINDVTRPKPAEAASAERTLRTKPPALHSDPAARQKIYLNFSGCAAAPWGGYSSAWSPPYDTNGDVKTFSEREISNIVQIWKSVSEDMHPFQLDVTTEAPPHLATASTLEVCIGGDWHGWYAHSSGGVAYVGSWVTQRAPRVFVFADNLDNGFAKFVGEAASHETGHAFGLRHFHQYDEACRESGEYNDGSMSGRPDWAPIMGVGYSSKLTTWSYTSQTTRCVQAALQDDLSLITRPENGIAFRTDAVGDSAVSATSLNGQGAVFSASGAIETSGDSDYYSFYTVAGTVRLAATSSSIAPNLDIALELYDAAGSRIARSSPLTVGEATLNLFVPEGTYYARVLGSDWYGSLGPYWLQGTLPEDASADTTAPTVSLVESLPITVETSGAYSFRVNVTDATAVTSESVDNQSIMIVGPNGFTEFAEMDGADLSGDGTPRNFTFTVRPPSGGQTWSSAANGMYWVKLQPGKIADPAGNASPGKTLGSFQVTISAPDSDSDGLNDNEEVMAGTDSNDADSDDDRVSDGQENADGSDPLDATNYLTTNLTPACAAWNGFFGMYNFFEQVNRSTSARTYTIALFDINGVKRSAASFSVGAGSQFDYPVHEMEGFEKDSYGQVCITGTLSESDSRVVHYRPNGLGGFQFALALPVTRGRLGEQVVAFNTFQPSLNPADQGKMVANWVEVANLSAATATGRMLFFDAQGRVLGDSSGISLTIGSTASIAIPAHRFGASRVGTAVWRPDNSMQPIVLRNIRYFYDNALNIPNFTGAVPVEAGSGFAESVIVALDTRSVTSIIELHNPTAEPARAIVQIYAADGRFLQTTAVTIRGYGAYHLITDSILGANQTGLGVISVDESHSVVATAMHYGRDASGAASKVRAFQAQKGSCSISVGTYNTYLHQQSQLVLMNPTGVPQPVKISMMQSGGGYGVYAGTWIIPANGKFEMNVNAMQPANTYGVVRVESGVEQRVVGWITRERDDFLVPTVLR